MIKIRERKDGTDSYLVRVKDRHGRWYPAETFDRKVDAERHERKLKLQSDAGGVAPTSEQKSLTVDEYWTQWSVDQDKQVHKGWRSSQNQMYRDYVKPVLGQMKLAEVKKQNVGRVLAKMSQLGRSKQTQLHVYNLMHRMFENAVDYYEYIPKNPVTKQDRPKVVQTERNFLEPSESLKLLEATRIHWLGPAIWLGLYAGLRPSEIQALQWHLVDRPREQILIRQAFKRKGGINQIEVFPKQARWGKAKMPKPLVQYLDSIRGTANDEDFVARAKNGGMLEYGAFIKTLKALCKELGLRAITPHELRHSSSELWVSAGATEVDIGRQLNQSSSSTTRRYMHRTDGRLNALAEKLGQEASDDPAKH